MQSRVYVMVQRLSVPFARSSKNAGSAMITADVGS